MQINANATNSVKLKELFEEQEKVQAQLDEKTERLGLFKRDCRKDRLRITFDFILDFRLTERSSNM